MKWTQGVAYGLTGVWAAWWILFALGGGLLKDWVWSRLWLVAAVTVIVVVIPVVAWRAPRLGGWLLVVDGLFLLGWVLSYLHNPNATTGFLILTLALPPLAAGLLLVTSPAGRAGSAAASDKPAHGQDGPAKVGDRFNESHGPGADCSGGPRPAEAG